MVVLFIKRIETTMKKSFVFLLLSVLFINTIASQTLIQRIENTYYALDSTSYIENIIFSFKNEVKKNVNEMDNLTLELNGFDYNIIDSVEKQHIIDSIIQKSMYSKTRIEERTKCFASIVKDKTVHYVLNLRVLSSEHSDNHICLLPDTSYLPFNLFYFDKRLNLKYFVLINNGQICHYDSHYRTFSKPIGRNAPKVFKKILRKNPRFLLYCYDLEQMNTILYALNDKIYVYRIAQMEEFELSEYIDKIMHTYECTIK